MPIAHLLPRFYREFSCIGANCEDNCCHGWTISIDKKTYRHYQRHDDLELRELAATHIRKVKKSDAHWGEITLNEHRGCPFLDQQGWCQIQSRAGAHALSDTCKSYPRVIQGGIEVRYSMTLSCPEVCRKVLLDPSAMELSLDVRDGKAHGKHPSPAYQALQQHALNIALVQGISVSEKIWVLGMLVHRDDSKLSHTDFLNQLAQLQEQGAFSIHFRQLPSLPRLQWWALRGLTNLIKSDGAAHKRGQHVVDPLLERIFAFFAGEFDEKKIELLQQCWREKWQPFFEQKPYILSNYLLYWLYHHGFPKPELTPTDSYRMLVADTFLLRCYLSIMVINTNETPSDSILTDIFYSYHSRRLHNASFSDVMDRVLTESGFSSDVALYSLLKE